MEVICRDGSGGDGGNWKDEWFLSITMRGVVALWVPWEPHGGRLKSVFWEGGGDEK